MSADIHLNESGNPISDACFDGSHGDCDGDLDDTGMYECSCECHEDEFVAEGDLEGEEE